MSGSIKPYTAEAIDTLMAITFHTGREARSKEYRHGCRAVLNNRLAGIPYPLLPYIVGTASCDAYLAGQNEGRAIVDSVRASLAPTEEPS